MHRRARGHGRADPAGRRDTRWRETRWAGNPGAGCRYPRRQACGVWHARGRTRAPGRDGHTPSGRQPGAGSGWLSGHRPSPFAGNSAPAVSSPIVGRLPPHRAPPAVPASCAHDAPDAGHRPVPFAGRAGKRPGGKAGGGGDPAAGARAALMRSEGEGPAQAGEWRASRRSRNHSSTARQRPSLMMWPSTSVSRFGLSLISMTTGPAGPTLMSTP